MNFFAKVFDLPQTEREELLDLHSGSLAEVRRSLHDIRRINRYLGGAKVVSDATFSLLQKHQIQSATILDIGTGSGDIPLRLAREAKRRNLQLRVLAMDISARHLKVAREDLNCAQKFDIHLLQADAFRLPLKENSADIVVSSLFLHHFRAPQIHQLLSEFERVSRVGWIMNDLVRHNIPLWFFSLDATCFRALLFDEARWRSVFATRLHDRRNARNRAAKFGFAGARAVALSVSHERRAQQVVTLQNSIIEYSILRIRLWVKTLQSHLLILRRLLKYGLK